MRKIYVLLFLLAVITACGDRGKVAPGNTPGNPADQPADCVLIGSDIVTDVIIRPDPEGDPWESEKVAGYKGDIMVNTIFDRIYAGTLTAYEYHSGEPMSASEVKRIEKDFNNDRSKIGKLSFIEDWYYYPSTNNIEKITKSIVFGFELYNSERKVYAYSAAFKADLGSQGSLLSGKNTQ